MHSLQKLIILNTLLFYGIALYFHRWLIGLPTIISKFFIKEDLNFLLQGTICAFFPTYTPWILFGLYTFAYRLEMIFLMLQLNKPLRKHIVRAIQSMRRSPIKLVSFVGRVGASGFMGGSPRMPGGNLQGMVIWGFVVVSSVAINQYRLNRNDRMAHEATLERDRMQTQATMARDRMQHEATVAHDRMEAEATLKRNHMQAQNQAYETQAEMSNKRPWYKGQPPQPPKF